MGGSRKSLSAPADLSLRFQRPLGERNDARGASYERSELGGWGVSLAPLYNENLYRIVYTLFILYLILEAVLRNADCISCMWES